MWLLVVLQFLGFFRPKPKFQRGQLLRFYSDKEERDQYLLVCKRRWERVGGKLQKEWTYDGAIFEAGHDYLFLGSLAGGIPEKTFALVGP